MAVKQQGQDLSQRLTPKLLCLLPVLFKFLEEAELRVGLIGWTTITGRQIIIYMMAGSWARQEETGRRGRQLEGK